MNRAQVTAAYLHDRISTGAEEVQWSGGPVSLIPFVILFLWVLARESLYRKNLHALLLALSPDSARSSI